MNKIKHLYIHIPFCKTICWYCDFKRSVCNQQVQKEYIQKIVDEIQSKYRNCFFETIYIGGGTPNCLDLLIEPLLIELSTHVSNDCEYTIECNPEFLDDKQIKLFKKYKVNRISLGVQSTNDEILKQIGRKHKTQDVINAIDLLRKNQLNNFSIDLIYGFNEQTIEDLKNDFNFIKKYKIPHVSFYCLEVKNNSAFGKMNYKMDELKAESMLKYIIDNFNSLKYRRYEVSNWAISKQNESKHNLAYWNTNDWIGLGYGAFGLENMNYYENVGSHLKWTRKNHKLSEREYYQQIWIMGLRTIYGLNLKNPIHKNAYIFFKDQVTKKNLKISTTSIKAKNLNTIDNTLIEII